MLCTGSFKFSSIIRRLEMRGLSLGLLGHLKSSVARKYAECDLVVSSCEQRCDQEVEVLTSTEIPVKRDLLPYWAIWDAL